MDYHLVDQAPRGSALSAYGMARGFRWNLPLLALVAGSLVLAAVAMAWFLSRPVLVPRYPLLVVMARPAVLHAAFSAEQRAALPVAWGRAIATTSHLPAVFAVALDEEGVPHSFAALPGKTFGADLVPTERIARWSLPGFWETFRADAAFALRGDVVTSWLFQTPLVEDRDDVVTGVWKDGVGRLAIATSDTATTSDIVGQLVAAFGDDVEARDAILTGLLSQGVDLRGMSDAPSATSLAISPLENRVLTLKWSSPLSEGDRTRVIDAGGEVSDDGLMALFNDTATTTADEMPSFALQNCPGTLQLVLEGVVLRRAFEGLHAPAFLQDAFHTFSLTVDEGVPLLCFR